MSSSGNKTKSGSADPSRMEKIYLNQDLKSYISFYIYRSLMNLFLDLLLANEAKLYAKSPQLNPLRQSVNKDTSMPVNTTNRLLNYFLELPYSQPQFNGMLGFSEFKSKKASSDGKDLSYYSVLSFGFCKI